MSHARSRFWMIAPFFAFLGCAAAYAADAGEAKEDAVAKPVEAIWKPQEISFYFQSFTTFYSCTGLEGKLERIMGALGAQDANVRVRSAECPNSIARMPRVVVEVISPVEATPEAIADRDKNKSTRELVARLKGERAEGAEITTQFPAQWKRVSLSRGSLGLEPGDCELIEEIKRKVLPKLAVRVVKDNLSCSPNQITIGQPQLEVEALTALPKPDEAKTKE